MPRRVASRRQAEVHAPPSAAHTASDYARHAPERTLLYALVQAHSPDFLARIEAEDRCVPASVCEEFEGYLRCGVLEHGFLRVVCGQCHAERLVAFSCKKRGFCPSCGAWRMDESASTGKTKATSYGIGSSLKVQPPQFLIRPCATPSSTRISAISP